MLRLLFCCVAVFAIFPGCSSSDPRTLHADGTRIVDVRNQPVQLRGVNLGGWLVEETWMMPLVTHPSKEAVAVGDKRVVRDHVSLWRVIEGRLGAESAARIRTALREGWINESDFDRIKAEGINCIRLPFLCSLFDEPGGIGYLDRAIAWAEQRGIYIILDMHGAPGCQSKDHHSGECDRNEFFTHHENVEKAAAIWQMLARRYKHRPMVAGYDLLNEPMGAPNPATMHAAHDRLYRAIRSVDPDRLIFIEDAYKGAATFPLPATLGWTNVVYSIHIYGFTSKSTADQIQKTRDMRTEVEAAQAMFHVPFYIGEFNQEPWGTRESMQTLIDEMCSHGWAYSIWTWKIVLAHGNRSMWGYNRNPKPVEAIDPFTDSEAEMIRKVRLYRTENLAPDARLPGVIGEPSR